MVVIRETSFKLYIGNLPSATTEESLKDFLTLEDKIRKNAINITMKQNYAFAHCADQGTADKVIDLFNSATFNGNVISVQPSTSRDVSDSNHTGCRVTFKAKDENVNPDCSEQMENLIETWGGVSFSLNKEDKPDCFVVTLPNSKAAEEFLSHCNKAEVEGFDVMAEICPPIKISSSDGNQKKQYGSRIFRERSMIGGRDEKFTSRRSGQRNAWEQITRRILPQNRDGFNYRSERNSLSPIKGKERQYNWRMLVPTTQVGALIGRNGNTIRTIIHSSGARINIQTFAGKRNDLEKVVSIRGTPEATSAACRSILGILIEDLSKNFGGGAEMSLRLLTYNSLIGRVIGKGGANIGQVMAQTKTRIHVSNQPEASQFHYKKPFGDHDRVITIRGSIVGMCAAEKLISEILRNAYEDDQKLIPRESK